MMRNTFAAQAMLLALTVLAMSVQPLAAQPAGMPMPKLIAAPAEPAAIPLYGDKSPGTAASENWSNMGGSTGVRNVSRPTLTPVLPKPGKGNGTAVIVAPGGAFMMLAIEHEGWKVARALADRGIAAFVLKYRLVETPKDDMEAMRFVGQQMMKEIGKPMEGELIKQTKAPEDARAAIAMVRANSAKWKIDPARVGIIGFSAGAMTARRAALDGDPAGRPNFVGYIYGPQDAEPVPADAPPLFNAIAMDDMLFPSKGFPIAEAWHAAKRPVETHAYQSGNHGFGLGQPGTTHAKMLNQFITWLAMNQFLTPTKK